MAQRLHLKLSEEQVKQAETDRYIVDRLHAAISVLKHCCSAAMRIDLHVILGAVAPERKVERDRGGMIRRVAERLGVQRGARYIRSMGEKRERVLDQSINQRAAFDEGAEMCSDRLKVGDAATSRGRSCTVVEIDYKADTCKLSFSSGGVSITKAFTCIYKGPDAKGKDKLPPNSARLRPLTPSLRPPEKKQRSDEKAEKAMPKVEELFDAEGARSPSIRDLVRRRVGPGLHQTAQALFVYSSYATLYALFCTQYPALAISCALFKSLAPWYIRRAKQEGCLCKHCENFKAYQETLHSVAKLFEPVVNPASLDADDAEGDDEGELEIDGWDGKEALFKLLEFCKLTSKSDMVKFILCNGAFDGAGKQKCINGECSACGFGKLIWSKLLRPHVVDTKGNLKPRAPVEFSSQVQWRRIRSSNKTAPGEAKQPSYEVKTGTVVEFLDEFERDAMRKFPHHRFTVFRQKAMSAEFERNRWPGWVQSDIDFAMDGDIPPPQGRAIQSEHWSPMPYTLFVQIVSWLDSEVWKDRHSTLPKGVAVTAEPLNGSKANCTEPAAGSYWAEVISVPKPIAPTSSDEPSPEPEKELYGVRRYGASDSEVEYVQRSLLRHRKLHTKVRHHHMLLPPPPTL